jgi:hypothetical protein
MSARQGLAETNEAYRARLDATVKETADPAELPDVEGEEDDMHNSGVFPGLSDGTKKTISGASAPKVAAPKPVKAAATTGHRRGGYAKHQKGGK